MARGQVTPAFCPGTDLDVRLTEASLGRGGRALEAEVQGGAAKHPVPLRLVGVHTPTGDGVFRTHLPPRIGPRPVADRSRVRGEVALRLRVGTSVHRLDEGDAERPCSVTALLQAALSAAMIAALLAPTPKRQTRPPQAGAARPLPPRRRAWPLAASCQTMAQACELQELEAAPRWGRIAALLMHAGNDPHWRRRPAVLAQRRGWKRQPLRGKQPRRRNLKATA